PSPRLSEDLSMRHLAASKLVLAARLAGAFCALLLGTSSALADGTGWYSADQISQGRWDYSQSCSVCHGAQLQGGGAPSLKGGGFPLQWNGKKLQGFDSYVHAQMPLGGAGSLKGQQYADIVAYCLAQNGLPAGEEKLTPDSPMD